MVSGANVRAGYKMRYTQCPSQKKIEMQVIGVLFEVESIREDQPRNILRVSLWSFGADTLGCSLLQNNKLLIPCSFWRTTHGGPRLLSSPVELTGEQNATHQPFYKHRSSCGQHLPKFSKTERKELNLPPTSRVGLHITISAVTSQ